MIDIDFAGVEVLVNGIDQDLVARKSAGGLGVLMVSVLPENALLQELDNRLCRATKDSVNSSRL